MVLKQLPIEREDLEPFILLARFHTLKPSSSSKCYSTYRQIGALLNISVTTVGKIVHAAVERSDMENLVKKRDKKRIENVKSK